MNTGMKIWKICLILAGVGLTEMLAISAAVAANVTVSELLTMIAFIVGADTIFGAVALEALEA